MKILHNGLSIKVKDGVVKSINDKKPLSYMYAMDNGEITVSHFVVLNNFLVYVETHDCAAGFCITEAERYMLGYADSEELINEIIVIYERLSKYGLLSSKQRKRFNELLEDYNDANSVELVFIEEEMME